MISETVTEPEWDNEQRVLLLAHLAVEADRGSHGIPMAVATDPANQFKFMTRLPTTDWAARTLAADQKAYYDPLDKAAESAKLLPVSRAGHMWSVYLPEEPADI